MKNREFIKGSQQFQPAEQTDFIKVKIEYTAELVILSTILILLFLFMKYRKNRKKY